MNNMDRVTELETLVRKLQAERDASKGFALFAKEYTREYKGKEFTRLEAYKGIDELIGFLQACKDSGSNTVQVVFKKWNAQPNGTILEFRHFASKPKEDPKAESKPKSKAKAPKAEVDSLIV